MVCGMTDQDKEELINRMTLLVTKTDGGLVESLLARLWVNKCIEIVQNYE
jgi:hypothetical protein